MPHHPLAHIRTQEILIGVRNLYRFFLFVFFMWECIVSFNSLYISHYLFLLELLRRICRAPVLLSMYSILYPSLLGTYVLFYNSMLLAYIHLATFLLKIPFLLDSSCIAPTVLCGY